MALNKAGFYDDIANLEAIYHYVEQQRTQITKYPALKPLIESFEAWYQSFEWVTENDIAEAKRRRIVINKAMGQELNPNYPAADTPIIPPEEEPAIAGMATKFGFILVGGYVLLTFLQKKVSRWHFGR
jgi:hypothetical protein